VSHNLYCDFKVGDIVREREDEYLRRRGRHAYNLVKRIYVIIKTDPFIGYTVYDAATGKVELFEDIDPVSFRRQKRSLTIFNYEIIS
tara:strand:+ start:102 stop:362 length:261 start_codon:yes stop_codon:yes gene_type:complete